MTTAVKGEAGGSKGALLPHHRAELQASGLTDETVAANNVYSESAPNAVAKLLNWSPSRAKALGPVLVYPHFDREGRPLGHAIVKPDRPRERSDKPGKVKYENPRQRPTRLYIPAGARAPLADRTAPIIITEGCKKALAATQDGFPCVSLPGVWNWVAPRETKDGKKVGMHALNADLAAVAWKGRRVYIAYDSDAATNPDVGRAERALTDVLRRHGADVRVIRLPAEPDGSKNGLDDLLVRHGPDALRLLVDHAPVPRIVPAVDPAQFTESGYTAVRGNTFHCVLARDGGTGELAETKRAKLANFTAKIVGETVTDDGAEQTREFAIAAEQWNKPARTAGVPVERFGALDWVVERFGPGYVIQAGGGKRDHLRAAIQEMSGDRIPSVTVYTHTGWREIGGRWCYLHGGGAIVPAVPAVPGSTAAEVRLDGAAAGFRLPVPPAGDALRTAVCASLSMLNQLVPDTVAFPLVATVYRAALGAPDYALWLSGPTGAQKSELAALAQQHFGSDMTRSRLPGNWSSTDNALEGLAFTTKDAVLVIDDFAPSTCRTDGDRQHRTAERLIRGQGNSAGRQRMRADGTLRPPKPPRGLILATGEDVPRGHSVTARLAVVAVQRGDVKLPRLSECQQGAAAGLYASAMAGFVAWLAPQYAAVRARLDAEQVVLRDRFVGQFPHARTPDIVANLLIGLRYLLRFAEEVTAIDERQRGDLWRRGEAAFRALAEQQAEHQRAADPVTRFPEMLAAIVSSGRGHLAGTDGKEPGVPPSAEAWGVGGPRAPQRAGRGAGQLPGAWAEDWLGRRHGVVPRPGQHVRVAVGTGPRARAGVPTHPADSLSATQGLWCSAPHRRRPDHLPRHARRRPPPRISSGLLIPVGETGTAGTAGTHWGKRRTKCPGSLSQFLVHRSETGTRNRDISLSKTAVRPDCPGCPGFPRGGWGQRHDFGPREQHCAVRGRRGGLYPVTATTILADLRDRGLSLRVEEGQLRVRPKALLTPADREGIRAVLPEILAALSPDDHLASPIVLPRSPVAEVWDQAEAIRLVGDADDLVAQRGVDGRLPVVVAAAATVASAYAIRDMETVRFAVAEFTVLVRQLAADQRQQRACKGQCRTWSP